MANRTFTTDFSLDIDDSTRRTYPAGWSGEVDDEIAAAADDAGATDAPAKPKGKKVGATDAPASEPAATEQAP